MSLKIGAKDSDIMDDVRRLCQAMGVRQKDLAATLGINPAQMNLYFQGKAEMRSERMLQLLEVLGVDVAGMLRARIQELGVEVAGAESASQRMLTRMGRLNEGNRRSLARIIYLLSEP